MEFVETHAHLDFPDFDSDREEVIKRAVDAGVCYIINVSASLDASYKAVELAHDYESVYAAVAVHPHDASVVDDRTLSEIEELARDERVVAIGEVGLDFYRNRSPKDVQRRVFTDFLLMAERVSKPVIVHSRDATAEAIKMVGEHKRLSGVFHCYSSSVKNAERIFELGFLVSVAGNITFPNAEKLRSKISQLPLEKLMLETDSPFLAPQKFRGKRCEPAYIPLIAEDIAKLFGVSVAEVADATTRNALKLFRIPGGR